MSTAYLYPKITLDKIYGSGLGLCPRPSPKACTWLPQDPLALEMLTGGMLSVAGDMPVVCAASVATTAGIRLLEEVGFASPKVKRYNDGNEHDRQLSHLLNQGFKIVLQHTPHPSENIPGAYWIKPSLLSFLNNKGNLAQMVEPANLPSRRILPPEQLGRSVPTSSKPAVIKAATAESTGGGFDVVICRSIDDLRSAETLFRHCPQVVAEEYLTMDRNLCLNYAIMHTGQIVYLGSAEQITDPCGKYYGNWIDTDSQAPSAAIEMGTQVARKGFAKGYWGILGIDMAILEDKRIFIFDLNFRLNGSTAALILADSIARTHGQPAMRLTNIRARGSYREMIATLYTAMDRGLFLPLTSCAPSSPAKNIPDRPRASGLVLGSSRCQIMERCQELESLRLETLKP
jgi:hypothetical protein